MKLEWMQQFYVAAKSRKPEKKTRESEEEGRNESIEEDVKFQKLEAFAKSSKLEERIETEELKRENDEISRGVPWNVDAKPLEEMTPEDPTTETSDRGTTMTEVMSSINLGEFVLHHATDLCGRAEWINDEGELPATEWRNHGRG